jgi:DNA-binding MarR family transcriptional regulator
VITAQNKHEVLKALIVEVFQTNGQLLAVGDRLSAEAGLTGARWQVIGALNLEQRALTVAQIARRMGLQRQSVQRLTDILVRQGLLVYLPNPEHKRAKLVDFTPEGREIYARMETIHRAWSDSITDDFTPEELQQAVALLHRLREKLGD